LGPGFDRDHLFGERFVRLAGGFLSGGSGFPLEACLTLRMTLSAALRDVPIVAARREASSPRRLAYAVSQLIRTNAFSSSGRAARMRASGTVSPSVSSAAQGRKGDPDDRVDHLPHRCYSK